MIDRHSTKLQQHNSENFRQHFAESIQQFEILVFQMKDHTCHSFLDLGLVLDLDNGVLIRHSVCASVIIYLQISRTGHMIFSDPIVEPAKTIQSNMTLVVSIKGYAIYSQKRTSVQK